MKVLYDHQIFELQPFGGISRYFYELWRHADLAGFSARIEAHYGKNAYLLEAPEFRESFQAFGDPWKVFLESANIPGKGRILKLKQLISPGKPWKKTFKEKNRLASLEQLAGGDFSIFHPTYYGPYFLDALKGRPFVLTVFDMIHERFPEYFKLTDRVNSYKYKLCQEAARIVVISEQTKHDLVTIFRVDPDKVDVVLLANSLSPPCNQPALKLPKAYILFTGRRTIYKNFYFMVRALANILRDNNLTLVCSGKGFSPDERIFFESLGIGHNVIHITGDNALLAYLYQKASAFIFPSLYEGFGLPVLEAFACGCPAILSNTSSLPEVGGDAAMYFAPKDMRSIQQAVEKVIAHEDVRQDLIAKGYERLKLFSWEKTARETAGVYRKALNS